MKLYIVMAYGQAVRVTRVRKKGRYGAAMLKIGKTYLKRVGDLTHLCADLTIGDRRTTLWFGVDSAQEEYLAPGRADAFVMALLPAAMRGGHEMVCEDPMSERLHYQLVNGLIPALSFAGDLYHIIKITAPLTTEQVPNLGAVGTGFSGGVDSLYTIMKHGADSEFPLTHIAIFNRRAVYDKPSFMEACRQGDRFARELGFKQVYLDTNLSQTLIRNSDVVFSFWNLACALALQRLFSVYLISSGQSVSEFKLDLELACDFYDPLTVNCASTESLAFYLSGGETSRPKKLEALTAWEPSWRWLHPCVSVLGNPNCGQCKKCSAALTVLYALGSLDRYRPVFDVDDYLRNFSQRIGRLLSFENSQSSKDALRLLRARNIPIPNSSVLYAKRLQRMRQLVSKLESRYEGGTGNEQ